ncbi:MAG: hypothetical protein HQ500_12625 [Flavobacteriales bacterium]|nr:hypothetical protein [Flavobacteriales bacterium]
MKILGIHAGHDASAALIVDGKVVADVAEERFNRIKHFAGLPIEAIKYCLQSGSLGINDVDYIVLPSKNLQPKMNVLFDLKGDDAIQTSLTHKAVKLYKEKLKRSDVKPPVYMEFFPLKDASKIKHIDHHLSHAASAYYTSGTAERQLIFTMDGIGDGASIVIWEGINGKITELKRFGANASLGWFYGNVTEGLGWIHGDGEGKTMGLDPYGNAENCTGVLDRFCPKFKNGELAEPHDFGRTFYWNENGSFQYHLEEAKEIQGLVPKYGREDIAAEAQRVLEREVFNIVLPWIEKTGCDFISCSGGIFLNVKLNQRLWECEQVKKQHIYANAGDSGLAVGCALQVYYELNPKAEVLRPEDIYWGPEYSNDYVKEILDARGLSYEYVENIEAYTAQLLADDKIIAWFQGRMESGPRALGNRSILMSPNKPENKDVINAKVKFREAFRPFCPSLQWEKRDEYLENARDEFFMITSFTCKEDKRAKVPAVVHADNTMRPQTVKKEFNERYWNLINEFGKLTGEYVLLNTSFNIMGEPMINHPREAIRCFYDGGIEVLVIGNYVLKK